MKLKLTWKSYLLISVFTMGLAIASIFLLYRLDTIVHGLLYEYGLVFSYEWAIVYSTIERTLFASLSLLFVFNLFSSAVLFRTRVLPAITQKPRMSVRARRKPQRYEKVTPQKVIEPKETKEGDTDGVKVLGVPMVCSGCGKVFTQPLCMFSFETGKPHLVNVCPYCNKILTVSSEAKTR